jgi:hypothetical protein
MHRPVKLRVLFLSLLVAACGAPPDEPMDSGSGEDAGEDAGADAGRPDAGARPDAGPDGGPGSSDGGFDAGSLITVSHTRELRGLWVTTVSNLDFPRASASNPDAGVKELEQIVNTAVAHGFNALVFQVRPESDAC